MEVGYLVHGIVSTCYSMHCHYLYTLSVFNEVVQLPPGNDTARLLVTFLCSVPTPFSLCLTFDMQLLCTDEPLRHVGTLHSSQSHMYNPVEFEIMTWMTSHSLLSTHTTDVHISRTRIHTHVDVHNSLSAWAILYSIQY